MVRCARIDDELMVAWLVVDISVESGSIRVVVNVCQLSRSGRSGRLLKGRLWDCLSSVCLALSFLEEWRRWCTALSRALRVRVCSRLVLTTPHSSSSLLSLLLLLRLYKQRSSFLVIHLSPLPFCTNRRGNLFTWQVLFIHGACFWVVQNRVKQESWRRQARNQILTLLL